MLKLKVLIRKCLHPQRYMSTPPAHTESSDHLDARLQLISTAAEMKGAATSKPCWASFRKIQTGTLDSIATGNKLVTSSACQAMQQLMNAPITSLLGYSSSTACSVFGLLGFLSGNLNTTSLTQPQSRDVGKVNYTSELPLTGNTSWAANTSSMCFNKKKPSCWRAEGDTEAALESPPVIHGHFLLHRTSLLSLPWQETETQVPHGG